MNFRSVKTWGDIPVPDYHFTTSVHDGIIYKYGGEAGGNDLYALNTLTHHW